MNDFFGKLLNYVWMFCLKLTASLPLIKEPKLFEGENSSLDLIDYMASQKHKSVLIVTGAGLIRRGQVQPIIDRFAELNISVTIFDRVEPDPTFSITNEALNLLNENNCQSVLAIGGGSAMDLAKVIALSASNKKKPEKLTGYFKALKKPLPFYAIPTTAGTGSEVTVISVISDNQTKSKSFVIDPRTASLATALDPVFMITIPPALTAATGMDALTHAIEAYVGRNGSAYTDEQALAAIRLIFKNLPIAFKDGSNIEARSALALASYKAGLAFTKASLGYVHAISHQLGAKYGVAHGLGNAIVLPHVIQYSAPSIEVKLATIAQEVGIVQQGDDTKQSAKRVVEYLFAFNKAVDIPETIAELQEEDFPSIVKDAMSEAYFNYPVPKFMPEQDCNKLLQQLLPNTVA